jgi:hypothetical protein
MPAHQRTSSPWRPAGRARRPRLRPLASVLSWLAVVALSACSPQAPTQPTPVDTLLGTWVGTVTEEKGAGGGTGTLRLTLARRDPAGSAVGTWEWSFPDGTLDNRGRVSTFQDQAFFFLLDTPHTCGTRPTDAFGAIVSGLTRDRLRAEFFYPPPCIAGSFDLRRQ